MVEVDSDTTKSRKRERTPAALRIARQLQERIERREFQPGEWLPTERDLAQRFQADRATIRAAIHHLAERRLILRESGRRPLVHPELAQIGFARESRVALSTIAAILPQPPNYSAMGLIQRGILRTLREDESTHRLVVFDNQGESWERSVELEQQALDALERGGIAGGILWHIGGERTLPRIRRLVQKGTPLVLLDRRPPKLLGDFVGIDNRLAAYDAVQYLLQQGHRKIAHITSSNDILTVREREIGYREALEAWGIVLDEEYIIRMEEYDDLFHDLAPTITHLLALPEPPTAIFAMKDLLAHAAIIELGKRGVRVPEDISVIGFDDQDRHSLQPAILTTVHQPFEAMGEQAAQLLLRRIAPEGKSASTPVVYEHRLLPTPLVLRSTATPPVDRKGDTRR